MHESGPTIDIQAISHSAMKKSRLLKLPPYENAFDFCWQIFTFASK